MWHTTFIVLHAAAGVIAFVTGCVAVRREPFFWSYFVSLALLVFFSRARWRWFAACWGTFAVTALVPIGVYWARHPGALTERYNQTSFVTSSMAPWTIAWRGVRNYVHDVNLWHWTVSGDPKPYVHTYGAGSIYATVVLLALGSVVLAVASRKWDRFWLFTVVLLVVQFGTVWLHNWQDVLPYLLMLVVLIIRPWGLLGRPESA